MDPMTAALLASAASAGMGALQGHKARSSFRKSRRRGKIAIEGIRSQDRLYGALEEQSLKRATEASVGGFESAERLTSDASRASRRSAMDLATEEEGELRQRFGGGAGQTTAFDMARAGLTARTTRRLQDVDAAFSGMLGQLAIGKGQARATGETAMANFQARRGAQERELNAKLFDIASEGTFGSIGQGFQIQPSGPTGFDASGIFDILKMFGGGGGLQGDPEGITGVTSR